MNSKEKLEELLKTNPQLVERFKKIAELPKKEAPAALHQLEEEFGIQLQAEDFAMEELDEKQLNMITGGDGSAVMDVFSIITGIYGLYPPSTGRGTTNGTKRFQN